MTENTPNNDAQAKADGLGRATTIRLFGFAEYCVRTHTHTYARVAMSVWSGLLEIFFYRVVAEVRLSLLARVQHAAATK